MNGQCFIQYMRDPNRNVEKDSCGARGMMNGREITVWAQTWSRAKERVINLFEEIPPDETVSIIEGATNIKLAGNEGGI